MEHLDHYQILGVAKQANAEQIRFAYRQAAQACHPDRVGDDPEAIRRFQQLAAAYRVLRLPALRQAYDAECGHGTDWKPWYGPLNAVDGFDSLNESTRRASMEGFERIALVLASGGFGAPRIAARLALSGCTYKLAWQIAWQARHQILQDELDQMFMQERDAQRATQGAATSKGGAGMASAGPATEGLRLDGDAAHAFAALNGGYQTHRSASDGGRQTPGQALAVLARPWRNSRPGRLQRLLMRISRIIGFMPARMSRENRKLLRLEYRQPGSPPAQ